MSEGAEPWDDSFEDAPIVTPRHSVLAIASLALALFVGTGFAVLLAWSGYLASQGDLGEGDDPTTVAVGFIAIGLAGVDVVALVLGVLSLFQRDRKRMLGILGIVLAAIPCLPFGVFMLAPALLP